MAWLILCAAGPDDVDPYVSCLLLASPSLSTILFLSIIFSLYFSFSVFLVCNVLFCIVSFF